MFTAMEKETGAKIIIRGKGSVKEGKVGRKDGQPLPGEDEPLHAYVTAMDAESVKKAVAKINEVIQQGVDVPEGQNDLRRNQLRELALLNGTLREGDGKRHQNLFQATGISNDSMIASTRSMFHRERSQFERIHCSNSNVVILRS